MENKFTISSDVFNQMIEENENFANDMKKLKKNQLYDQVVFLHLVLSVASFLPSKAMKKEDFVQYINVLHDICGTPNDVEVVH